MKFFRVLFSFLFIIYFSSLTSAESEGLLNKLLAPGPLILGHKDLEGKDCLKCHDAGKGVPDEKCLECHKDIRKFVDSKKGFHGLNTLTCMKCHTDHKGREFDSTKVDFKNFDHSKLTGYSLEGKHADIKCLDCHREKRTEKVNRKVDPRFFGQVTTCISCHKKDDVHFFKGDFAKKDCNACHTNKSWKENVKFNHNTDTKFKLVGHHLEMKCNDCHKPDKKSKNMKYAWGGLKENQCLACHKDFHGKNLSSKFTDGNCTACHTQEKWKIENFSHEITKFKLNGKHMTSNCINCHTPVAIGKNLLSKSKKPLPQVEIKNLNFTGLKTQCLSCHEDFHKFGSFKSAKLGDLNQCLKCHTENDWNKTHHFEHNIQTRFSVEGQHLDLKCASCHLPDSKEKPKNLFVVKIPTYHWNNLDKNNCEVCHKSPHIGVFTKKMLEQKCTTCHSAEGWNVLKSSGGFDHAKTRFSLTGTHKAAKCSDCHGPASRQIFKFKSAQDQFCIDCHKNIHIGQFSQKFNSQNCAECHTTENFNQRIKFDHSKTNYSLNGEHIKLDCIDCHKPTKESITLAWPNVKSKDHLLTKTVSKGLFLFPQVKAQKCLACHTDYHKGQLSSNCTDCHSEKGWRPVNFVHNTQSKFLVTDKHEKVDCVKCHIAKKETVIYKNQTRYILSYKPLKSNCIDCHNDYHKGQLSSNCNECHSEKGWKPTSFVHNKQSRFKLKDKHEKIDCVKCHLQTKEAVEYNKQNRFVIKFKPISTACADCHKDPHKGNFGRQCQECHAENGWRSTKDFHKNFTLTGVHFSLECGECHKDGRKLSGFSQNCLACHQKDDIHNGTLPNCKSCHSQHFWEASHFRHSLTQFSLRGAHRTLDCGECHTNGVYKGLSSTCVSCHLQNFQSNPGPHGSGNTNCIECHKNTFTFKSATH